MPDEFKRNIAYKLRIGDVLLGKPILEQDGKFKFLELGAKTIIRVNIIGNVVDKYENDGEKKYVFMTIDDGSGQIKLKAFGDDALKLKVLTQGQTISVIGTLRFFNNEVYISPEITKEQDPRYLLIRKLEIEKEKKKNAPQIGREQIVAIKDKILEAVKAAESDGGAETEKLILNFRETSSDIINQEIKKMLEEGIIFEPRPGKLRYLG